ncbi:COX15/CtaA family protein [Parvibaculum sp.]|uniref:COX15/CtaA family protein n=1 Tax=Parvibaculum sp. TaxID=2024848 RepID=UPI000C96DB68|nr:COX15/CtaA family protein [Parvibaculum sp.]MAB13791.1 heme A synthase [Parvibaculum sp.]
MTAQRIETGPSSHPSAHLGHKPEANRQIAIWLFGVAALIFVMVVVGGLTRLTESGLSITEWKPVTGALPPLSQTDWQREFDLYKQIPQYAALNKGMSLSEFKQIYWWEWGHRLLGRLIGFAFLIPFLWFAFTKKVERALVPKLAILFVLGGLQGALGWWMVKSGLVHRTEVSQYRLAAHLTLALILFAYIFWTGLSLWRSSRDAVSHAPDAGSGLSTAARWLIAGFFLQIVLGAFVAGTRAGFIHNTWPLIQGAFFAPEGLFHLQPWWSNFFENLLTVQYQHRMFAYVLVILTGWHWWRVRASGVADARLSANCLLAAVLAQVVLGIGTLVMVVPIPMGAAHQAGAVIVLAAAVWHAHRLTPSARLGVATG